MVEAVTFKKESNKSLTKKERINFFIWTHLINFNLYLYMFLVYNNFIMEIILLILINSYVIQLLVKRPNLAGLNGWNILFLIINFFAFGFNTIVFVFNVITIIINLLYIKYILKDIVL